MRQFALTQQFFTGTGMAAPNTPSLQDTFLKHLCDNNIDVTMFLVNGIKLVGQIRQFDNFTVRLVRGSGTQVVYKHAISAIHPVEPVELLSPSADANE
jgi:host factor-I protein